MNWSLFLIVFAGALTQAITGNGVALIAMPLLVGMMTPLDAAALVATLSFSVQIILLLRYRRQVQIGKLWRLITGALIGIPIGVYLLTRLDRHVIITVMGIILVGYSLYSLIAPRLPEIKDRRWAFGFGFVSGLLGGAYNTGGPPYVIWGVSQGWQSREFKGNMQLLLLFNTSIVVTTHLLAGHYHSGIAQSYLQAVPAILLGTLVGFVLDHHINETAFRRLVLLVLLLIGAKMLIGG